MNSQSATANSALGQALLKLVEAVQDENTVLREHRVVSHAGFADRKNQALRELMAAQRREMTAAGDQRIQSPLKALAAALQENARLLKQHIAAVGEISDIIVGSLKEADWDGTYSRGPLHRRG